MFFPWVGNAVSFVIGKVGTGFTYRGLFFLYVALVFHCLRYWFWYVFEVNPGLCGVSQGLNWCGSSGAVRLVWEGCWEFQLGHWYIDGRSESYCILPVRGGKFVLVCRRDKCGY